MGSKAQAKASSEYAKYMKEHGVIRKTMRCPKNAKHVIGIGPGSLMAHLNSCGSKRNN